MRLENSQNCCDVHHFVDFQLEIDFEIFALGFELNLKILYTYRIFYPHMRRMPAFCYQFNRKLSRTRGHIALTQKIHKVNCQNLKNLGGQQCKNPKKQWLCFDIIPTSLIIKINDILLLPLLFFSGETIPHAVRYLRSKCSDHYTIFNTIYFSQGDFLISWPCRDILYSCHYQVFTTTLYCAFCVAHN